MNSFNEINRDLQKRRAETQKKAKELHQEELVRMGISEEQYQKIKKQKERNERIKETAKGILAFIGLVAVIVGAIALFSTDFGENVVTWIGVVIVLGIMLIGIWLVYQLIHPAIRYWNVSKTWKIIIAVVVSLLIVVLVVWIIGSGPDINPPIHERL